jgi:hypothetical protein
MLSTPSRGEVSHRLRSLLLAGFVAAVALLLPAGSAKAASVPLTAEELMAVSDDVVTVRVGATESKVIGNKIITEAEITVLESFKGDMKGTQKIAQLGGKVGPLVMRGGETPLLAQGEEAILFLSHPIDRLSEAERKRFDLTSPLVTSPRLVGGNQGLLRIASDTDAPAKARAGMTAIPADAPVARLTVGTRTAVGKAVSYGALRDALHDLAKAQREAAKSPSRARSISGIAGRHSIPEKSKSPAIRAFDPLPNMAYMNDAELKALKARVSAPPAAAQSATQTQEGAGK